MPSLLRANLRHGLLALAPLLLVFCTTAQADEKSAPQAQTRAEAAESFLKGKAKDIIIGALSGGAEVLKEAAIKLAVSLVSDHKASATVVDYEKEAHVGVGDVYQIDVKLEYTRHARNKDAEEKWEPQVWTFGYDVYVDDKPAYTQTLAVRQAHHDELLYYGETLSLTKTLYLMAAALGNPDCKGQGSSMVTVRAWIKEEARTRSRTAYTFGIQEYGPWKTGTKVVAENVNEGKIGAGSADPAIRAAERSVIIHNPWAIGMDAVPREVNHSDPPFDSAIRYRLTQRRAFPASNIGSPPSTFNLITRLTQNSSAHIDVKERTPGPGLISFSDKGELTFSHPFHFEPGKEPHFSPGDQKIVFSLAAEIVGQRQLKDGVGEELEWRVTPQIVAADARTCDPYVWELVDRESYTIDPCLVGTWEAPAGAPFAGYRVIFRPDGTQIVDYSKAVPLKLEASKETITWTGIGSNLISTANKAAQVKEERPGSVKLTLVTPAAPIPIVWDAGAAKMPGPGALGSAVDNTRYACTDASLSYQGSTHRNRQANFPVNLKKLRE